GTTPITNWADQSGNGNDATPAPTGPDQITSTNMNNKEVMDFSGVGLNIPDNPRINTGTGYNGDERTMFLAFKTGADVTTTQYLFEEGGGTNGLGVFVKNGKVYVTIYNDKDANRLTVFNAVSANKSYVLSFLWNKGVLTARLNNNPFTDNTGNGTITTLKAHSGDISIGYTDGKTRDEVGATQAAGANYTGEIAELIYYDEALTSSQEISINDDLGTRYGINVNFDKKTYYSYQSGNWNNSNTWTHDPGGTTQTATDFPNSGDAVVILNGRTVSLSEDEDTTNLEINIKNGGILNLSTYKFSNVIKSLDGEGTLRLASTNFPSVTTNNFISSDGGTTEYNNTTDFTLPSQSTYNNLKINASGVVATQLNDITLNGDLIVENGTYRINNNTSTAKLNLTINGDVTVNSGASITVGQGSTNSSTTSTGITGGTPPFIDYYTNFHTVILKGNFTNNGTVRFTNLAYPVFNAFPPTGSGATSGAASVYFMGATDNTLTCNGKTDFYNIIVDKGVDQTFKLNIYSSAYNNFRLFGANNSSGDITNATNENPNIKKALWIRTGSLVLKGLTIIPSLSEGNGSSSATPNSDFYIPVNGALVLDGDNVVVLSTADTYEEVNVAYGVSGGTGSVNGVNKGIYASSFSIYGKLQIDKGYFSTRESGGFITWDKASGQLVINGGVVDAKQFRAAGTSGLASYNQTGGEFILRGRFQRTPSQYVNVSDLVNAPINTTRSATGLDGTKGTFNINNAENVFAMSGGKISIYDACGTGGKVFDILSSSSNNNVTGGTLEIIPTDGSGTDPTNLIITSNASLGNLLINRQNGASNVQLNTYNLNVLNDFTIQSGYFDANNLNVSVGGDFSIASGTTYNEGTNWTIFNGSGNQTFTVDLTSALSLNKFKLDKSASDTLKFAGSQKTINIADSAMIINGTLDDNGNTINIAKSIYNSGVHTGSGKIVLNSDANQNIDGDGTGVFQNIELNKPLSGTCEAVLNNNITINGVLTFSGAATGYKLFNIKKYNLNIGVNASISGTDANKFIKTNGEVGNGGITKTYSSTSNSFVFPVGAASDGHATAEYTPATISFTSDPSTYGSVTVNPVGMEHPVTTAKNRSLTYYWRVKSSGFSGIVSGSVSHSYAYSQNDVVTSGDVTEAGYVGAFYNPTTYSWTKGTTANVDASTNTIFANLDNIDGEYTAGDDNPTNPFGTPVVYYSRQSGSWGDVSTWSLTSHNGDAATSVPGASDIVIIGGQDSVYLSTDNTTPNTDVRNCASLQIEKESALDIGYNPACNFGVVLNHSGGNGNFRLTTSYNSGSTYEFPSGDFSEFNTNLGTTELYTTNGTAGTTYWLPNDVEEYGNLIISPLGGSNIIFPNIDLLIYGSLITKGQNSKSWFCPTWNSDYPTAPTTRIAKTITIKGNFELQGGALVWYGNNNLAQDFVIYGDLIISDKAGLQVYDKATNQNISIGGNLINNAISPGSGGSANDYCGCDFTNIPVTFFGNENVSITNTSSTTPYTVFDKVTVNKGSSQATTLTCDIAGTLTTPTDNWLTLKNGTFKYLRTNPNSDFTISTSSTFTIPSTAGLYVDYPNNSSNKNIVIANAASDNNDLFLNGKLTVKSGNVLIGNSANNNNNDIEYSGGGASEIDIQGGNLTVNGQIRRNLAATNGTLIYNQTGGSLTINGNNAITANAKLEILNDGSEFNMSAGTINIVRGGGGNTYGDLYLRPSNSSVTGGEIIFSQGSNSFTQNYILDANIPLNNLTINGTNNKNATVKLLISALVLNGNLSLANSHSIFDANTNYNINVTIKGDFDNNGSYNHYNNLTTFNGGAQSITGSSTTDFYNLTVNPVTSLTLNNDIEIYKNLELVSGQLICGSNTVDLQGNFINNATYTETSVGVILDGTSQQLISGTGTFGRLELNNISGARLENAITLNKNFALTNGIFDINKYLLTLGENSNIEGSGFSNTKMITSDGVFSAVGISKVFSSTGTFIYPIGTSGKYTPAVLTINTIGNTGSIRINNINKTHPTVLDPDNVLHYYWEVESSGITGFDGKLVLNYLDEDVKVTGTNKEADYIAAGLLTPGSSWMKVAPGSTTDNVDEVNNTITFDYLSSNSISGEYAAGIDAAIPDQVPEFTSKNSGSWSDKDNWLQTGGNTYTLTGAPNGFIVIIDSDDEISVNNNNASAYRITINGKLKIISPTSGHNLGTVSGSGTLYLESGTFPAGRYTTFLDCANNGTLEYGGSSDYTLVADLYDEVPNLVFSGTGTRTLPNKDLSVCNQLNINGPILDNSVYNKKITIKGDMNLISGSFNSGSGADATISFAGTSSQTLKGFSGTNALNNIEINNNAGLTLTGNVDVKGDLLLTDGVITTTSANILTITNTDINCVTPAGGSSTSYVDGHLVKKINQGDNFRFPVGKNGKLGNKINISSSQTGTILWDVEYFVPNSTYNSYTSPLSYVNSNEYWTVSAPSGSQANMNLDWDAESDLTPLSTQNGVSDMRVAKYNTGTLTWEEVSSSASGSNSTGTVSTSSRITIPTAGSDNYTTACINTIKPRAKLTPSGPVCGTAGIPITFTSAPALNYVLSYSVDGVAQTDITVTATPYVLPTPIAGAYKLTAFTYNNGSNTGVVDAGTVNVYEEPTVAAAGDDQSLCGATSATLTANSPTVGIGLWSIETGTGGSFNDPTVYNTTFNGTNGSSYTLKWTITNGDCESFDEVDIVFPLLAAQPGNFIQSSSNVCSEETGVIYTVPNDATVTYSWSYSGSGATINGSGNSVTVDFASSATNGTLSVTASNACGTSAPREIAITVNPLPVVSISSDDADNTICTGTQVNFTANSSSGPSITDYNFHINGSSVQDEAASTYSSTTLAQGDKVSVIAMTAAGCTSTSNEITMSVADGIWTGNIDNDWFKDGNWECGNVPIEVDDVIIPTGASSMPVINDANGTDAKFRNIIIENSATLTTAGNSNLDVYGNFTNDGSFIANSGSVTFKGTSTISGSNSLTLNNVIIDGTGALTGSSGDLNITGDFTNNGSFINNNGTIIFDGSSSQTISGDFTNANSLNNVTINNLSGVTLKSGNKTIDGILSLTLGKLTSADLLTLGQNATTNISAASGKVTSYIVGSLSKIIQGDNNGTFFFPIGTSTSYKPAGVINVSGGINTWEISYSVVPQSSNIKTGEEILRVSNKEGWIISATGTANIVLSWDNNFDGNLYVDDLSTLRIAHLNSSSEWVSTGHNSSTTGVTDFGTITSS
ncbi:MAG: hypothetical protein DRJ01_06630, partial [Bacteroidetes bacterium]